MRSCCKQVRDFLDYGRQLHAEIHAFYDNLNEQTVQARLRLLLEYLSRHEQHLEDTLARVEHESRRSVLDAWLEHAPSLNIQQMIEQHPLPASPTVDDVVAIAMMFDEALVALYRDVAGKAHDERVRAVFNNLVQLEDTERVQVLRSAAQLRDM